MFIALLWRFIVINAVANAVVVAFTDTKRGTMRTRIRFSCKSMLKNFSSCDALKNVQMNKFVVAKTAAEAASVSEFRTNFYIAKQQNKPRRTNAFCKPLSFLFRILLYIFLCMSFELTGTHWTLKCVNSLKLLSRSHMGLPHMHSIYIEWTMNSLCTNCLLGILVSI